MLGKSMDAPPAQFRKHHRGRGIVLASLASLALAGCTGTFGTVPIEASAVQNERATLAPGQSATFGADNALRITFREVEQDSRCPMDAQCVWSGDAAVLFRIELHGSIVGGTTLHTHLQPQRIVINDEYALRLVSVSPDTRAGTTIAPGAYRVTIEVSDPD